MTVERQLVVCLRQIRAAGCDRFAAMLLDDVLLGVQFGDALFICDGATAAIDIVLVAVVVAAAIAVAIHHTLLRQSIQTFGRGLFSALKKILTESKYTF